MSGKQIERVNECKSITKSVLKVFKFDSLPSTISPPIISDNFLKNFDVSTKTAFSYKSKGKQDIQA